MPIDPKTEALIQNVRETEARVWEGALGESLRPWFNFADLAEIGKFEFEKLFGQGSPFNRSKLDDDYLKARQSDPQAKDIWIPKLSSDLLAGFQRDYAMRTRSRVRLLAHAAVRHKANGQGTGALTVNTITMLGQLDAAQEA